MQDASPTENEPLRAAGLLERELHRIEGLSTRDREDAYTAGLQFIRSLSKDPHPFLAPAIPDPALDRITLPPSEAPNDPHTDSVKKKVISDAVAETATDRDSEKEVKAVEEETSGAGEKKELLEKGTSTIDNVEIPSIMTRLSYVTRVLNLLTADHDNSIDPQSLTQSLSQLLTESSTESDPDAVLTTLRRLKLSLVSLGIEAVSVKADTVGREGGKGVVAGASQAEDRTLSRDELASQVEWTVAELVLLAETRLRSEQIFDQRLHQLLLRALQRKFPAFPSSIDSRNSIESFPNSAPLDPKPAARESNACNEN